MSNKLGLPGVPEGEDAGIRSVFGNAPEAGRLLSAMRTDIKKGARRKFASQGSDASAQLHKGVGR